MQGVTVHFISNHQKGNQMAYDAKIVADSVSPQGHRLTTMEVTLPRIVLAEFNTHRVFSRNSASSRAIPVKKRIERVMADPFIPTYWGANQKGMQAEASLEGAEAQQAELVWCEALENAIASAMRMDAIGAHKQLANRLLEPFMWQTIIVTATEWSNFFALRDNEMAQPEIHEAAHLMRTVYEASSPTLVQFGEWHLPLIQPEERDGSFEHSEEARRISTARCARVSYLTHDGRRDLEADLELYERLVSGGHMSPLEHVATPLKYVGKLVEVDETALGRPIYNWFPAFEGNFRGWKQFRKLVPHEDDFSAR